MRPQSGFTTETPGVQTLDEPTGVRCEAAPPGADRPASAMIGILEKEIERSVRELMIPAEEVERLPSQERHDVRNDMQAISFALHLFRGHVNRGGYSQAAQTMNSLVATLHKLLGRMGVGSAESEVPAERTLVVSDEPAERELLAGLLRIHDFEVVTSDGECACDQLQQASPSVVIFDLHGGKLSGLDVVEQASSLAGRGDLRVFVLGSPQYGVFTGLETSSEGVFDKPYDPQALVRAMLQQAGSSSRPVEVAPARIVRPHARF
ncbi:MAG: response regulator [Planctomycetota bacterium]|nr:MAG: response regulator [Planctomycetota bacterium]REJ92930.1 MAG: response regulator [Planctomycetota bacterium]REK26140.1 MAG: response regulator [Planctomycetota bacterium]REK33510.1 MAG: response regulator [Planctomycetota bacterium]